MFYDADRVAAIHQGLDDRYELLHIGHMEPCRGFIQNKQIVAAGSFSQLPG